jgi:glycosyltransferase involved in cell wall biosynthesis
VAAVLSPEDEADIANSRMTSSLLPTAFEGRKAFAAARPTLLLCGHYSSHQLFGAERSFLDVAEALGGMDVNLVVTLPGDSNRDYVEALRKLTLATYSFPYPQWRDGREPDEFATGCFGDLIARHGVDIVYANTIVLREPLVAAQRMGCVRVIHARELITLDAHLAARIGAAPQQIVQQVFQRSDFLVANSAATHELFYRPGRTFYVPNAVKADEFDTANDIGARITFGIVSNNLPKKGIDDFIAVALACRDLADRAEFLIVGPDNDHIKAKRSEAAVARAVRFAGYIDRPSDAMQRVNVLLGLSHIAESFGRTVAEAMASRRPVVAYEWGATPELVEHGVTGFLAPHRNVEAVAALVRAICTEPSLIRRMGEEGRRKVAEKFSMSALGEALGRAIGRILEQSSGSKVAAGLPA